MAFINVGNGHWWCEIQRDVNSSTAAGTHSSCLSGYFFLFTWNYFAMSSLLIYIYSILDAFAFLKDKMLRWEINEELSALIFVCALFSSCADSL